MFPCKNISPILLTNAFFRMAFFSTQQDMVELTIILLILHQKVFILHKKSINFASKKY